MDRKTIAGVELEAVRFERPVKHWRVKVVPTGVVIEAGVFKGSSRPVMWEDIEYRARRFGEERFAKDLLEAA